MEVTVKTLDSQSHKFSNIDDTMTVKQFKGRIASRVNVHEDKQRLIFRGRVLRDDQKLRDCDVDGKVLHLVERAPPSTASQSGSQGTSSSSSSSRASQLPRHHHHLHHYHRTTTASAQGVPSASSTASSLGSFLGNLTGVPSDVVDMTEQIVQGLVGSFEHGGAQTEVTSASSVDGRGVNVQINVNRMPVEIARLHSCMDACRRAVGDVKKLLDRREGVDTHSSTFDSRESRQRHGRGFTPAEVEAERQALSGELSQLLLEMVDISRRVERHMKELARCLSQSSEQQQPTAARVADTTNIGQLLQAVSHAYSTLRDVEVGLEDLAEHQEGRRSRESGQQQQREGAGQGSDRPSEEQREDSQRGEGTSSQATQGSNSQSQAGSQSAAEASHPPPTSQSSQQPSQNQYAQSLDALERMMGTPVARMEIEMDQYEAPLQEVLTHGFRPPPSSGQSSLSERHPDRPSVEFMFNFIQHIPAGGRQAGQQQQSGSMGQSSLTPSFLRSLTSLLPQMTVRRGGGGGEQDTEGGQTHQQSQQSQQQQQNVREPNASSENPTASQTVPSESMQSQQAVSGERPVEQRQQEMTGETHAPGVEQEGRMGADGGTAGDAASGLSGGPTSTVSPEMFRTVSETLVRALASAYSDPSEDQPSVHELFSGLADLFGEQVGFRRQSSMFSRFMDTLWNILTTPEALALFRGHVEPLQKLQNPYREFVSREFLQGAPLTESNVEEALDCFFKDQENAIEFMLKDCRVCPDVDLHATLLQASRRHFRHVLCVVQRDYDAPFGFANALKAAFVGGVAELSHLAVYGLEGGREALHDMLRARLVEVWGFPITAEEFHRWSYRLCIGEYIDAVLNEHRESDEHIQQLVVWRQSLPPAVAVDAVECHADQESEKEVVPRRQSFPLPQWLQSVPDGLPDVNVGSEEWHQSLPNQVISVVARDLDTQRTMPNQRPFSDAYTSCMPPKRRKASEIVSTAVEEATGDTLRSAISAAGVASAAGVDDIVRDAGTHPGLTDTYRHEFQLQLEERVACDADYDADAFPNSATCFGHPSRPRRS